MKYFKVTTKCGHVGAGNYIPITFAVRATDSKDAKKIALNIPRVKRGNKNAILNIEEVSQKEYNEQLKINSEDLYLQAKTKRDLALIEGVEERIVHKYVHSNYDFERKNPRLERQTLSMKKKHSFRIDERRLFKFIHESLGSYKEYSF